MLLVNVWTLKWFIEQPNTLIEQSTLNPPWHHVVNAYNYAVYKNQSENHACIQCMSFTQHNLKIYEMHVSSEGFTIFLTTIL